MRSLSLIFATIMVISVIVYTNAQCAGVVNGMNYDLSPLTKKQGDKDWEQAEASGQKYFWNFCAAPVSCPCGSSGLAYQTDSLGSLGSCEIAAAIGPGSFTPWLGTDGTQKGITVTWGGGSSCSTGPRQFRVNMTCDPSDEGSTVSPVSEDLHCVYDVAMKSKYACGKPSVSGGWIFFTLLLVGTAVYCGAGYAWNYKKRERRGVEAVPNVDFWRDLPSLVKDGFKFVFAKATGKETASFSTLLCPMDLTAVFHAAIHSYTTTEANIDAIIAEEHGKPARARLSPMVKPNPLRKHTGEFTSTSMQILEHNRTLCAFLDKHGRNYVAPPWVEGHISDSEREAIDVEVRRGLEQSCVQIDNLRQKISKEPPNLHAHEEGVVAACYEAVERAAMQFASLKEVRLRQAISSRRDELRANKGEDKTQVSMAIFDHVAAAGRTVLKGSAPLDLPPEEMQPIGEEDIATGMSAVELEMLTKENTMLQRELDCLGDQVKQVESQVADITSLQQVLSARVLEQSEQIDRVQQETEKSTDFVKAGTKELGKAASNSSSFRFFVLLFFVIASFALIFLDWYS